MPFPCRRRRLTMPRTATGLLLLALATPAAADGLGSGGGGLIDVDTPVSTPDGTPDAFTFGDFADMLPGTTLTSGPLQVSGFDTAVQVSVENGTFLVILADTLAGAAPACDGRFDITPQVIGPGDYVCVQQQASTACGASRTTILHVGLGSGTLRTTTLAAGTDADGDGTPDCVAGGGAAGLPPWLAALGSALLALRRRRRAR